MNPQVIAALISAIVALLGIAGAIVGQAIATRRAFRNSLALFERQHAAEVASRRQELSEAGRREEAQRFAEERRVAYARFLRLSDEVLASQRAAETYIQVAARAREKEDQDQSEQRRNATAEAEQRIRDAAERGKTAAGQLVELRAEIELLASEQVRASAWRLADVVDSSPFAVGTCQNARSDFLEAVRRELGMASGGKTLGLVVEDLD
jgi:hypothetical protein